MTEDFSFEEDGHCYRNSAGIIRPSVTQCLHAQGIFDLSMVPEDVLQNARRRGVNVHRWTAEYDQFGSIDDSWIADDERGYFEAWLAFRRESECEIVSIEQPALCTIGGIEVGGTPDRIIWMGPSLYVNDIKCCAVKHPGWALQVALYEMQQTRKTRCGHMGRMVTQLFPTGKYSCIFYEDPADADAGIAALTLTAWEDQVSDRDAEIAQRVLDRWKRNVGLDA